MKIAIAAVADHAWVERGCLSICRTIDTIYGKKFPHVQPRLSIALRVLVDRSEAGKHKIRITLADYHRKKVMSADAEVNVQLPPSGVRVSSFAFALNGQGVKFPAPGEYSVDFVIDNKLETSLPLYVRSESSAKTT